jgi:hypothetical protein
MDKVAPVSPVSLRQQLELVRLWAPADHARETIAIDQATLCHTIGDQRKNGLGASGSETHCPLACPARNRRRLTNKNYNRIRKPAA